MAKPDSYHRRHRRKRKKQGKITIRSADGAVRVVKPGHFVKKKRQKKRTAYQVYLDSAHWKKLRAAALLRDGYQCRGCSSRERLQVHHFTYERMHRELLSDVVTLCDACHRAHHRSGKTITKKGVGQR